MDPILERRTLATVWEAHGRSCSGIEYSQALVVLEEGVDYSDTDH